MTYDLILTLWVILNRMATIPNTLPVQRRSSLFGRSNPSGPGRRLCLFWYVGGTLAIKGSNLRKTKYLPLVTFFVRFLLLYSDQVDLLVGIVLSSLGLGSHSATEWLSQVQLLTFFCIPLTSWIAVATISRLFW
jgi:hypothetical protein